jgi:hypothetical protein
MHPQVLAQRSGLVQQRLAAAASVLSDRFDIPTPPPAPRAYDPAVSALYERERIAELLEAMVAATSPAAELPDDAARLTAMTVTEARTLIEDTEDVATLDVLADAERAGKDRKGVHEAIEVRRSELASVSVEEDATSEDQGEEKAE